MFFRVFALANSSVHVLSLSFGALAVIVQGISLAVGYLLIKNQLGAGYLGVWALIQATLIFGRVAEFGLSQSLIHFIPKAMEDGNKARAINYFDTVIVASSFLFITLSITLYAPANLLLQKAVDTNYLDDLDKVFPFAVLAFVCVNIGQAGINALIGLQKAYLGHLITIISFLLNILVVLLTVQDHGLVSLAYGNLTAGLTQIILGNILTSINLGNIPFVPIGFKISHLRKILGIGIGIQSISIFSAIADASVKFFINHFIGIQAVGIYEMSNRFILFVRGVFALPQNYLGSFFAGLNRSDPQILGEAIDRSMQVSTSLSFIFAGIVINTHIWVGEIWVGNETDIFETMTLVLIIGWFFNVMVSPIYYFYLGFGKLHVPIFSQAIYAGLVFTSCFLIGSTYGLIGLVLCMTLSLSVSQIYMFARGVALTKYSLSKIVSKRFALMTLLLIALYHIVQLINDTWILDWSTFERFIAFCCLVLLHLCIHLSIDSRILKLIRTRDI